VSPGRRAFLRTAVAAVLAAVAGEWWARRRHPPAPEITPFPIPGAAALGPGQALGFAVPGTGVQALLVRLAADRWVAFDRRCPHLGCPVLWSAADQRFDCPCHRASFAAGSGRVVTGPPRRGLRRIGLEVRADEVWARGVEPAET
jgi:Rieske Fe-S protein